ncbi:MAG: hypothetical protein J6A15_06390 [Clostridia bacterium]|nr:hypothetical protein [Clostridia bacterium]
MKNSNNIKWRKLDNSAKIFPMSTGQKYSSVFRLSVVLNNKVNPKILYEALLSALEKYEIFKVRMKAGLFWYYLEENTKAPIIEEENEYPCKYINPKANNGYLFKVTYFKNKINIDIFHALTDGNGGNVFFRELVYTYLEMCHPRDLKQEIRRPRKIEYTEEDSYIKNYSKKIKTKSKNERAYELKGKKIRLGAISTIHQIIDLEKLKIECSKYDATVTQYLTAVLMYAIYNTNYTENKGKKPLKICVPVNLKKYFPSKTLSNFFSYIILAAKFKNNNLSNFDEMIEFVKKEFKERLTEEEVLKVMSSNVKLGNNFFIKIIPLFLKNILVRIGYLEIRKHSTITYSNIGRIGILGDYQKYIKYFIMLIAPDPVEKIKCSSCTFENKIVFTFTSILNDNKIERVFYEFLINKGIDVTIESNGVLDDISRKIK